MAKKRTTRRTTRRRTSSSKTANAKTGNAKVKAKVTKPAPEKKTTTFMVTVTLEKIYTNKPSASAKRQLDSIARDSMQKVPGWTYDVHFKTPTQSWSDGAFQYVGEGKIIYRTMVGANDDLKFVKIRALRIIGNAIRIGDQKGKGWTITKASGPSGYELDLHDAMNSNLLLGSVETAYIQLPDEWESSFKDDIYGLDPQIRVCWDAMTAFVRSQYQKRSHICFHGQPGCGKTTVCERFYDMVKETSQQGACIRFTASQTTKAGLENTLIEVDPKPSLIFIEEIDKCDPMNMSCLMDVCNAEGRIKKTTATHGNIEIPLQALVICTVNNVPKFLSFMSGALASRFAHKIFFPRPNKDVMRLIGLREVRKYNGKEFWVGKALKIMESEGTNDPRRLRAILDAGDRLCDGSYARDMKEMGKAAIRESDELKNLEATQAQLHESISMEGV